MAEILDQLFWIAVTVWSWAVLTIMALGPVLALWLTWNLHDVMARIDAQDG